MNVERPSGIVLKYYLYRMTLSAGFTAPIYVVFLQSKGISLAQVSTLSIVFSSAMVFGETPSGYIGDRIGRRNSLLVSVALLTVAMLSFGLAESFLGFVLVYVLWGVGMTFQSGTASAWLYDALKERTDEDEYARVSGRANALTHVLTALTSLLAGYLASIDLFYPFLATAVINGAGFFVVLSFPESSQFEDDDSDPFTIRDAVPVVREHLLSRSLRSFVVYTVLLFSVIMTVRVFIQPASTSVGLNISHLGYLYAGFTGVSAVGSYFSGTIKDRIGIRRWVHAMPLLLGALFAVAAALPLAILPVFFVMEAVKTVTRPLRSQYINDHTASVGRATVLSAVSMLSSLVVIPFKLAGGVMADAIGAVTAIAVLGGVLLVGSAMILAWERPVKQKGSVAQSAD